MKKIIILVFAILLVITFVYAEEYDLGGGFGITVTVGNVTQNQTTTQTTQQNTTTTFSNNPTNNNHNSNNNGNSHNTDNLVINNDVQSNNQSVKQESPNTIFIKGNSVQQGTCINCFKMLQIVLITTSLLMLVFIILLIKFKEKLIT